MGLSPSDARGLREHFATRRKSKGYTQAELSEAIGKGEKYISRIETGEIDPPLDTLADIAKHLDLTLYDLLFFEGFGDTAEELRSKIQRLVATDDLPTLRRYYRLLLISSE
jgi:transcriptional regulator with XRE-family HTH domain